MKAVPEVSLPAFASVDHDEEAGDSLVCRLSRQDRAWPAPFAVALLVVLVMLVGWVDYITGFDLSVSLLYFIPIAFGTWVAGRSAGIALALFSAVVWLAADLLGRHAYGHWLVPAWNTFTLAISFVVVAGLLGSLLEVNRGLEQTVASRTRALRLENEQRRRAEEDLVAALDDLGNAHRELRRTQFQLIEAAKVESVARLATGIAHEVKNPLMTLSLGVDHFLSLKPGSLEEAQLTQDMKEAVNRAGRVINLLLDYAKPKPLERTKEDIRTVIENSLALVRHQLAKHGVKVVLELDTTLEPLLLDRTLIEQVFVNLFLNAIQAMAPGGVLTVRSYAAGADSGGLPAFVTVGVDDTGHGIGPEDMGKLFEPFFTTRPAGQGAGLGLAMSRQIMRLHDGSISLSNRPQGGARVTLQFKT